jgi:hypothetical protein
MPSNSPEAWAAQPALIDLSHQNPPRIAAPDNGLTGKVARVNAQDGYVVLTFPAGHMPVMAERLALYRNGMRVGEVKVTGPQNDDDIVADVVNGDAAVQDEARVR